jgi:hypothetical protein
MVRVGQGEGGQPAGGQLDGRRHSVETADGVGNQAQVRGRRRRTGADPAGPVEEDDYRGNLRQDLVGAG